MFIITLRDIIFIIVSGLGLLIAGVLFIIGTIEEKHKK